MQPDYFEPGDGRRIAFVHHRGHPPGVMFLTGLKSDMTGAKALALEAHCRAQGCEFLRFDYTGHGASSGRFEEGTIGQWRQDALDMLDKKLTGPVVLVGSSLGGWIALLLALARPKRVAGLVGIAPAPDFTERLWHYLKPGQQEEMQQTGKISIPNCYGTEPYIITKKLVDEARGHLVLDKPIPITCPVRLLHGEKDEDVPWQISVELLQKLAGGDAALTLVKDAGHRLSEPSHLALLCNAVDSVVAVAGTGERKTA